MIYIPEQSDQFQVPEFQLVKASAGSGKTRALTQRYIRMLLSENIPHNQLQNILAVTFSKNAAKEMKARILTWLKAAYFGDPEVVAELTALIGIDQPTLQARAKRVLETILDSYSDFQVRTIDSFMTSIFKTSAVDLGFSPEFAIVMDAREMLQYALERYLSYVSATSISGSLMRKIIRQILNNLLDDNKYLWDPTVEILKQLFGLNAIQASYKKPFYYQENESQMNAIVSRSRP